MTENHFPRMPTMHGHLLADNTLNDVALREDPFAIAAVAHAPAVRETTIDASARPKLAARGVGFRYGAFDAVRDIDLDVPEMRVTALIGPSGCGKSTLLRVFNRIYAL